MERSGKYFFVLFLEGLISTGHYKAKTPKSQNSLFFRCVGDVGSGGGEDF